MYGSNNGTYPCWEAEAVRFSTGVDIGGWKNQRHTFKYLKPDSPEYLFLVKHYECWKENFLKPTENKSESKDELKTEDSKTLAPIVRHKLMSLLTLVNEFTSSKKSRSKNKDWSECIKLGTIWRECMMMEDEDDDTPDFNFVLPKKLKPTLSKTIIIWKFWPQPIFNILDFYRFGNYPDLVLDILFN